MDRLIVRPKNKIRISWKWEGETVPIWCLTAIYIRASRCWTRLASIMRDLRFLTRTRSLLANEKITGENEPVNTAATNSDGDWNCFLMLLTNRNSTHTCSRKREKKRFDLVHLIWQLSNFYVHLFCFHVCVIRLIRFPRACILSICRRELIMHSKCQ